LILIVTNNFWSLKLIVNELFFLVVKRLMLFLSVPLSHVGCNSRWTKKI